MNGTFERRYASLRRLIDRRIATVAPAWNAQALKAACHYVLAAPGKRVRSTLLLLSCEAVGGKTADAVDAGIAVEIMHNFTLVHDDIMDNAPSRRGKPTVHVRWDLNTALLAGDVILGLGYASLLRSRTHHSRRVAQLFTEGLLEVCDGQGLDLEFERRRDVTLKHYFRMIEKKTGKLLSISAELGGILGGGTPHQIHALRSYGLYLGRAFQLQDDLLDVVADQQEFGKPIGGDILEGKKTYLLLSALERARGRDRRKLSAIITRKRTGDVKTSPEANRSLVREVTALYEKYGVLDRSRQLIRRNTGRAIAALAGLPRNRGSETLRWFAGVLVHRTS